MSYSYRIEVFLLMCLCTYLCQAQNEEKPEGSSCTVGSYNGTCLNINHCYHMIQDLEDNIAPQHCSFKDSTQFVCCTECSFIHVENISNAVLDPQVGMRWKNGRKSWDKCLDYFKFNDYPCKMHFSAKEVKRWNEKKMCHDIELHAVGAAGGEDASRGEFPHMALLGYGSELDTAQWLCGGTLISEDFILTAGHCISSSQLGPIKYAALGILKRSDPADLWDRYKIGKIIPHPDYKSPSKYHDIALLQTETNVKFNKLVLPACLPVDEDFKKDYAIAAGWGALGHKMQLADILQKVYLKEFQHHDCANIYKPHRHLRDGYNNVTQMCFGDHDKGRDTCEGDSGGPLQYEDGCITYVIGVTSYGVACGFAGNAGMYTRVAHYVPWIESVVWAS